MSLLDDSSLAKRGLSVLVRQGGGIVAIVKKLEKEFSDAPVKDRVAMERWMQFWCDGRSLPPERFKIKKERKGKPFSFGKSCESRRFSELGIIIYGNDQLRFGRNPYGRKFCRGYPDTLA